MTRKRHYKVKLREDRTPDGEVSLLEAYIDSEGNLVLAGQDFGKSVRKIWKDFG